MMIRTVIDNHGARRMCTPECNNVLCMYVNEYICEHKYSVWPQCARENEWWSIHYEYILYDTHCAYGTMCMCMCVYTIVCTNLM